MSVEAAAQEIGVHKAEAVLFFTLLQLTVVVLAGRTGGKLAAMLRETDVLISVPHDRAARVREVHTLVLHCLSDGVDAQLLGEQEIPL